MVEESNERPQAADVPRAGSDPEQELIEAARKADPDRALILLLSPVAHRAPLCGLVILNNELARVPFQVSDMMLGLVRLQWWRDALTNAAEGGAGGHPALVALAPALREGRLPLVALVALVDAREQELDHLAPADLDALDAHMGATAGALGALMAGCLGASEPSVAAARLTGQAFGLVRTILAAAGSPHHLPELLPEQLVTEAGLMQRGPLEPQSRPAVAAMLAPIVARARSHLAQARTLVRRPPREQISPFLLAPLTERYLRAIEAAAGDLTRIGALERPGSALPAMLLGYALRRP
jgi:phytoene/squalene synthetase